MPDGTMERGGRAMTDAPQVKPGQVWRAPPKMGHVPPDRLPDPFPRATLAEALADLHEAVTEFSAACAHALRSPAVTRALNRITRGRKS